MPTISKMNQDLLDKVIQKGIKPEHLIKKYGIFFILNLLENVKQERLSIPFYHPKTNNKNKGKFNKKYEQELMDAGFTFREFKEDFVDEDTGEVVSIARKNINCIKI